MKPNFALNFTETSIGLLHRTSRGWLQVGTVGLDEPDLGKALTYLRGSALGLEPRGITSKLVLPNSQIRYMTLPAPGPDAASRRAQIREALEGKTPYAVDELVFDWSGTGETVQVAVAARETLEEAENFAQGNRFNPVSFVAIPDPGSFDGEPWFGPSAQAARLLAEGEKVERDQDPIKIVGRTSRVEPAPVAPAAASPDSSLTASETDVPAATEAPSPAVEASTLAPEVTAHAELGTMAASAPAADEAAAPAPLEAPVAEAADPLDKDLGDLPPLPVARIAAAVRAAEAAKGQSRPGKTASSVPRTSSAEPASQTPEPRPTPIVAPPRQLSVPQEVPAGMSRSEAERMTVFGARKTSRPGKPRYLFVILVVLLLAVLAAVFIRPVIMHATREAEQPALASATEPTAAPTAIAPPETSPAPGAAAEAAATPVEDAFPATESATGALDPEAQADLAAVDPEAAADLAATDPEAAADLAATDPEAAAGTEAVPPPVPEPPPEPALRDGSALSDATGTTGAGRLPGNDPQDEIFLALVGNRVSTSDAIALQAPVAATDAVPEAQPLPPPFGMLYPFDAEGRIIPTPEGIVTPEGVRLVAGKPPRVPPARPEAPAPVAAEAGQPTEPGAEEPVQVQSDPALAGARPRVRPAGLAPAPAATTDDEASLTAADTAGVTSLKPRSRPPELLARGEAEFAERTAEASAAAQAASASLVAGLADGTASPLAVRVSRKPAARPQTLDRSIEAAVQLAAADASLVPDTALLAPAALAPAEPPPPATAAPKPARLAKAPALSLPPEEPAPSNFSTEEANDPAVVEMNEPDTGGPAAGTAAKSIVAKKATYANALNMSKVSLIGVFGSPSNRYAMVRQPGGRVVKVEVGDRIDGGQVAAISERDVSYVKNGQTHTLSMPKG